MPKLHDAFPALESLYAEVPAIPCKGGCPCCVNPHLTLVEFAYYFEQLRETLSEEEIRELFSTPPEKHRRLEGNMTCRALSGDGWCRSYAGRGLACRLEGMPVLDRMGFRDVVFCPHIKEADMPVTVTPAMVEGWTDRVFELDVPFHAVYSEPYWVKAIPPECWLAVALDPAFEQPYFAEIRDLLRSEFDLDFLREGYRDHTRFAEKIRLIDTFFAENERKRPEKAFAAIRAVIHDFPATGTHYHDEGREYFKLMKQVLRDIQGKN